MVKVRLSVLDLELIKVLFINPNLTLTFDPATLIHISALIHANLMRKSYHELCPVLANTDLQKSFIVAYKTLLGGAQTVCFPPETVVDLRRTLVREWNHFPWIFFHRPGNSLKNTCKAVIAWI